MRVMIAIPQQRTTVRPGKHAFELRRKWCIGDDISCAHAQLKYKGHPLDHDSCDMSHEQVNNVAARRRWVTRRLVPWYCERLSIHYGSFSVIIFLSGRSGLDRAGNQALCVLNLLVL